jgi:hypothetical protein
MVSAKKADGTKPSHISSELMEVTATGNFHNYQPKANKTHNTGG